jgi:hypothetical protein
VVTLLHAGAAGDNRGEKMRKSVKKCKKASKTGTLLEKNGIILHKSVDK